MMICKLKDIISCKYDIERKKIKTVQADNDSVIFEIPDGTIYTNRTADDIKYYKEDS